MKGPVVGLLSSLFPQLSLPRAIRIPSPPIFKDWQSKRISVFGLSAGMRLSQSWIRLSQAK
jgi:hypothetical protein